MPEIEGRHGGKLIPPQKGEIRNPKGRGKGVPNTATRLRKLLATVVKLKTPNAITGQETLTAAEMLDLSILQKGLKGDVNAYREIMDRLEGKVIQKQEIDVGTKKIEFIDVSKNLLGSGE